MSRLSPDLVDHIENLHTFTKGKAFLGREFLTWLWYQADSNDKGLKVQSVDGDESFQIQLWIDDRMIIDSSDQDSHSLTLKGGDPCKSLEAHAALKSGKTLKEMKLGLEINGIGPFTTTLSSDGLTQNGLSPKALNLPKDIEDGAEMEKPLGMRIQQIELFNEALDALFAMFFDERSQKDWEGKTYKNIKNWISARKLEDFSTLH